MPLFEAKNKNESLSIESRHSKYVILSALKYFRRVFV